MLQTSNRTKTSRGEILMSGKIDDTYEDDVLNMTFTKKISNINICTEKDETTSRKNIDADDILPPSRSWPYRPLFIQADKKLCSGLVVDGVGPNEPVPLGEVFKFESDLFIGKGLIRIRRTKTNTSGEAENQNDETTYFKDRKRFTQVVIQGKFKEKIPVTDVVTGRDYEKPLQKSPPKFIARVIKKVVSSIASGVEIDLGSKQPKVRASLAASVQILRADEEGNQPDISLSDDLVESSFAFGHQFSDSQQRKKILSDPMSQEYFDTETIYTFESYDNILDYWRYNLNLAVFNFDMTKIVNRQPFQFNAMKKSDGKYVWLFQIWHERLL